MSKIIVKIKEKNGFASEWVVKPIKCEGIMRVRWRVAQLVKIMIDDAEEINIKVIE